MSMMWDGIHRQDPLLPTMPFKVEREIYNLHFKNSKNSSFTPMALKCFVVFSLIDMNIYACWIWN